MTYVSQKAHDRMTRGAALLTENDGQLETLRLLRRIFE